jgi:hypothetical protein
MTTVTLINTGDDYMMVEGFTKKKIPCTAKELPNKRYFRKWEKKLAIACGKRCSKCSSNATTFQNKAHGKVLQNAGISKVKCHLCGRCL